MNAQHLSILMVFTFLAAGRVELASAWLSTTLIIYAIAGGKK